MAVSLLFGAPNQPNTLAGITLDVTLEEVHQRSALITDHPVENGVVIQDHISNDPRRLKMTGFITDTPLVILGTSSNRAQSAFDELERLYDERDVFTVVSGFRVYENMAFESLILPKRREGALRFTADLKQLTFVQSELAAIPASRVSRDARDLAASQTDAGRTQAEPVSGADGETNGEAENADPGSVLYQYSQKIFDAWGAQP